MAAGASPGTGEQKETRAGNYFVANYPPFSFWDGEQNHAVTELLEREPAPGTPLGLYVHIPFCRKRCDFCYFKVYTDKGSREVQRYLDAVQRELAAFAAKPYLAGRRPRFLYFGGGTPSYLSTTQLQQLFEGLRAILPWDDAEEIAFECEPGTLQEGKIRLLRSLGVTRLSLGVENFDPGILAANNRAHLGEEIYRAYGFARDAGFPQVNVDLIAGMVGETDANWERCVQETVRLEPESVTIYQMEVPFNTTLYGSVGGGETAALPVADWDTKRRWVAEAFERLEDAGYHVGSAYTACRNDDVQFLYRDALWRGADLLGIGVSSFSHLGGVHFQNEPSFEPYLQGVEADALPLSRAYVLTDEERLIREFILQMKLGSVEMAYFQDKFGVDVLERFREPLAKHAAAGWLVLEPERVRATRPGLLRIDSLLHDFFLERHCNARYT